MLDTMELNDNTWYIYSLRHNKHFSFSNPIKRLALLPRVRKQTNEKEKNGCPKQGPSSAEPFFLDASVCALTDKTL